MPTDREIAEAARDMPEAAKEWWVGFYHRDISIRFTFIVIRRALDRSSE